MFPSTEELIPEVMLAKLPYSMVLLIKERYETLGVNYLTNIPIEDGRLINKMMITDRIENCLEEVIDAVFCILGWSFKCQEAAKDFPIEGELALNNLIQTYSLLKDAQANGSYS
jgi:hypothetical protein